MKTITYDLPESWACPLMYDDESGLTDYESRALALWLEIEAKHHECFHCIDISSDEGFFMRYHDAHLEFPYASQCAQFTFQIG